MKAELPVDTRDFSTVVEDESGCDRSTPRGPDDHGLDPTPRNALPPGRARRTLEGWSASSPRR